MKKHFLFTIFVLIFGVQEISAQRGKPFLPYKADGTDYTVPEMKKGFQKIINQDTADPRVVAIIDDVQKACDSAGLDKEISWHCFGWILDHLELNDQEELLTDQLNGYLYNGEIYYGENTKKRKYYDFICEDVAIENFLCAHCANKGKSKEGARNINLLPKEKLPTEDVGYTVYNITINNITIIYGDTSKRSNEPIVQPRAENPKVTAVSDGYSPRHGGVYQIRNDYEEYCNGEVRLVGKQTIYVGPSDDGNNHFYEDNYKHNVCNGEIFFVGRVGNCGHQEQQGEYHGGRGNCGPRPEPRRDDGHRIVSQGGGRIVSQGGGGGRNNSGGGNRVVSRGN